VSHSRIESRRPYATGCVLAAASISVPAFVLSYDDLLKLFAKLFAKLIAKLFATLTASTDAISTDLGSITTERTKHE
jgi:hypothetical protein